MVEIEGGGRSEAFPTFDASAGCVTSACRFRYVPSLIQTLTHPNLNPNHNLNTNPNSNPTDPNPLTSTAS